MVGDAAIAMAKPCPNQILRSALFSQECRSISPEGVEAGEPELREPHACCGFIQGLTVPIAAKQEAAGTIARKLREHRRKLGRYFHRPDTHGCLRA